MIDNVDINKIISPVSSRGKVKSLHQQHPDKQHKNFNRQLQEEDEDNDTGKDKLNEMQGILLDIIV